MVAAEKKEEVFEDVEKILINKGYRVTRKNIFEKDLMGKKKNYEIIYAVSGDDKTVITIRFKYLEDSHRLHISTKTGSTKTSETIADRLEAIGLRVHDEEKQVSASGVFKSKELVQKVKDLLNSLK